MAIKHTDTLTSLASNLGSPDIVTRIDQAILERKQDYIDEVNALLHLRKTAALMHGETSPAPNPTVVVTDQVDSRGETQERPIRDGTGSRLTVEKLIEIYRAHERSPYQVVRHATRQFYEILLKRLMEDCGSKRLADLNAPEIQKLYEGWSADGKLTMGRSVVTMLRGLVNFGVKELADADCERLSAVLHAMSFKTPRARTELPSEQRLNPDQALQIVQMAVQMERPSVAVAQAFQLDCGLRQKDVIGEWVPLSEPGRDSDVVDGDKKWVRGLRWEEIGGDFVLRHAPSIGGKVVSEDLLRSPTVMGELCRISKVDFPMTDPTRTMFPAAGPIVVCEYSGLPWTAGEFRRWWRKIARACGIPDAVRNMDSRFAGSDADDDSEDKLKRPADAELQPAGRILN